MPSDSLGSDGLIGPKQADLLYCLDPKTVLVGEPPRQSLNNLAGLYLDQGYYSNVVPSLEKTIAIRELALGPKHPEVARTKHHLAFRAKIFGLTHREYAASLSNLAGLYQAQRRHAEAEPLYQRALVIYEKALSATHPEVATSLDNLAALHASQGNFNQAARLFARALTIREQSLGASHPEVADTLNNLASSYSYQGMIAEAEPLYLRGHNIREKAFGPNHPHVAQSHENLAGL